MERESGHDLVAEKWEATEYNSSKIAYALVTERKWIERSADLLVLAVTVHRIPQQANM